ncbi:MAG: hypothetical protein LBD47_00030 [Treponema sp.]|nr:hypothetical protein [Treponema sp.]
MEQALRYFKRCFSSIGGSFDLSQPPYQMKPIFYQKLPALLLKDNGCGFTQENFNSFEAFPKLQFWESSLEIRSFARLKA